jgi:signal transduction histidine kinase
MYQLATCLQQHDPRLVAWAVVVCLVAVSASFSAYRRAILAAGAERLAWCAASALVLGSGVWAMHFMAMLAFHRDMRVDYDLLQTGLSCLVAILGFGAGITVAARLQSRFWRGLGGAICGASVAAMHFVGVAAMRMAGDLVWNPVMTLVAVALGIGLGAAAFVAAGGLRRFRQALAGATLLTLAIAGMHFTAMAAVTILPAARAVAETASKGDLPLLVGAIAGFIAFAALALLSTDRLMTRVGNLRSALDSAPAALAYFDAEARLEFWSAGSVDLFRLYEISPRKGLALGVVTAFLGLAADDADPVFAGPDGRWRQMQVRPARRGGCIVVITDISEHIEVGQREADARRMAEASSRAKSEFLANVSHEIRTPLNAVLGMAQVMARDPLSQVQRGRLEVIGEGGKALLAILDTILDLSKVEAGRLDLDVAPFDLGAVLTQAADRYRPLILELGLAFHLEVAPEVSGVWLGDGARLGQILGNLLSNALKFTATGSICLRAVRHEGGLRIEVADTGIGIAADKQAAVFETFTQADASTSRRYGGTGLGLTISRRLVELMGGELTVASLVGVGSTFRVDAPLRPVSTPIASAPAEVASSPGSGALRLLAAEDNAVNRTILSALLEPFGVELVLVGDGLEAVAAWDGARFDLILMDIQMPNLNGLDATVEIRRLEAERGVPRTPILALTANVMRHQLDSYRAAGMDGVVAKPIEAGLLIEAIEAALGGEQATAAAA